MTQVNSRIKFLTLLLTLCIFFPALVFSQIQFTEQSGGVGLYVGYLQSDLRQPESPKFPSVSSIHTGWEIGIKKEMYRTKWMRGNVMIGYAQLGAEEWMQEESNWTQANIDLQAIKLAFDPIFLKAGNDNFHVYAGGGLYGTFIFDQQPSITPYWSSGDELSNVDGGLDIAAGIHIWRFDIEFHAQYGLSELGRRLDNSIVKQRFFGVHLTYLHVNQHVTVKSCRDKRH